MSSHTQKRKTGKVSIEKVLLSDVLLDPERKHDTLINSNTADRVMN